MIKRPTLVFFAIFLVNSLSAVTTKNDSIKRKYSVEFKAGVVYHLEGWDDMYDSDDKVKSRFGEIFNLAFGRTFHGFLIQANIDYTQFNLTGNPKTVVSYNYNTSNLHYVITQDVKYHALSAGLTLTQNFRVARLNIAPGLAVYYNFYKSHIILSNHYYGDQPTYAYPPRPAEDKNLRTEISFETPSFFYSLQLKLGYYIHARILVQCSNALFYDRNVSMYGSPFGLLPKQNIYIVNRMVWLNTGLSATYFF